MKIYDFADMKERWAFMNQDWTPEGDGLVPIAEADVQCGEVADIDGRYYRIGATGGGRGFALAEECVINEEPEEDTSWRVVCPYCGKDQDEYREGKCECPSCGGEFEVEIETRYTMTPVKGPTIVRV